MARVIAGMTVSLDGFVQDAEGSAAALYPDLADLQDSPYTEAMQDETGAVLMGRRTFDMAGDPDGYADTYELQVPIFVLTHTPPAVAPKRNERLSVGTASASVTSSAAVSTRRPVAARTSAARASRRSVRRVHSARS